MCEKNKKLNEWNGKIIRVLYIMKIKKYKKNDKK